MEPKPGRGTRGFTFEGILGRPLAYLVNALLMLQALATGGEEGGEGIRVSR